MKNGTRTRNSFLNASSSLITNVVSIIVGIIARAFFIRILNNEYLGLNGLFSNIISMLGIVELGIGSAIIFNLYKPIAKDDKKTIKSLMSFYRKCYYIIGIIVLIIGIIIIPFLPYIINEVNIDVNIYLVFVLFLLEVVFSYFLSYKRSILYANQKNYIINIIHLAYIIFLNIIQIVVLYITKSFYLYLILKIVFKVLENIVITLFANRLYPFLLEKNIEPLDKNIKNDIFKKVKALFFHQIGAFVINGTDNIIISKFLGLAYVGLYSNYYLIINSVQTVSKQIIDALTPSIGNLLATENEKKQYEVFSKIRFLNFWIATFCAICIYVLMEPFIRIWIGSNYLLANTVLLILSINLFQKISRQVYLSFKNAAGIFYEDRFIPLIESVLNIIVSIVLVKIIGLSGVFIGTVVSGLALWLYSYPKYVYKKIFKRGYGNYFAETFGYIALFIVILFITNTVANLFVISNLFLSLVIKMIICTLLINMLLFIIFYKTENMKYYIYMLKKLLRKKN